MSSQNHADFLVGGGEMGKLIGSMDWSLTPLGPLESWPQSLRTTVSLCLASNFPISIAWGKNHTQIYNDGYWPICGAKHPTAMGQDYTECWASAWPAIGEAFDRGLAGEASYIENQRMYLDRNGYLEETFFTFSFSPIRDESGGVGGLFHPVTEQTAKMLSERRTRALRDLAARTGQTKTVEDVIAVAAQTLAEYDFDLPFVRFCRLDADGTTSATPNLADALRGSANAELHDLEQYFGAPIYGPYEEPVKTALALALVPPGSDTPIAFLIAGVSTRLPFNEPYRDFYSLIAATITSAIASAHAWEGERKRAEALAELDRAKTTFFSNISHEFRTPLSLMLAPLEDALGDSSAALPAAQRERLDIAHRNANRLLKLVNTLLDFSRIEAGRTTASFQPVDLAALTTDLASNFRSICERAGLNLVIDCPPLPEPVYIDSDMWEKIVLNLLSNAFKFTFEGAISVVLRLNDSALPELSIRDTGTGIPASELPRLFERFHRIEGARGRTYEGSGIGLALVNELTQLHGGTLTAESEPDHGSVFRITVPFGSAHLPANRVGKPRTLSSTSVRAGSYVAEALRWLPDALASEPDTETTGHHATTSGEVLLADDNADMRNYVARILQEGGYYVRVASDGEEALAAIRAGSLPDLLLSDVMMPKLDGFGLLKALRSDAAMEGLPVILLSARAGEEARVEGLTAGADDYLVKPFSARELLARVNGAVRLSRLRRETAERERDLHAEIVREQGRTALQESETKLHQAQKMQAIGHLTGGMAHDFNNLLSVIIGSLDMLGERTIDSGTRRLAQMALAAALRGAELTKRLLAFARQQPLQVRAIALNELVESIAKLLTRVLGEEIEISLDLATDVWPVVADPTQLEAALTNLSTNARDAMPRGGRLTFTTSNGHLDANYAERHNEVVPGDYAVIEVSDNGEGMSAETLARIFEPFFTTKEPGKGTGLGLAMTFGFMKQSGGHINVYSEVGIGTRFRLYLPRGKDSEITKTENGSAISRRGYEVILVVEDNVDVRAMVTAQLVNLGYEVLEAENAAEALKVLEGKDPIDIMLSDVVMPGKMNGLELARTASERWPALRIVLTSGFSEAAVGPMESIEGLRFLSKPYRMSDLARVLREVVEKQSA